MRVAILHDWLTGMRGGERVLEQLLHLYPQAELFTLLHVPGSVSPLIQGHTIHTSPLQSMPGAHRWYRYALPLFPRWIEQFDLRVYDLVISSSHCVAKGGRPRAGVPHVCYCHTPMRYLYDQSAAYAQGSALTRVGLAAFGERLRAWDRASALRVSQFVANSTHVRDRIRSLYHRQATVVHPPVQVDRFHSEAQRQDFYVCISALVPYKRIDLLVDAFNQSGRRLIVIGSGPDRGRIEALARSNVSFTGWIADGEVADLLSRCRGFVFSGVEDFGIAMVEAMASGAPVIAYARGGALDSVTAETGVLFDQQTAHGINRAIETAEQRTFVPAELQAHARRFDAAHFRAAFQAQVDAALSHQLAAVI